MTLNDLERRNSPILRFLPNSTDFQAGYVTVVEDRPIMSVKYCLPVPVFHFWPTSTHPAARSLCDSWAICCNWESVISMYTRWEVSRMSEESRPTVSDDGFDEWMLGSCLWQWRRDAGLRLCRWQWHCIEDVFTLQWRGLDTGWVNYQFSTRTVSSFTEQDTLPVRPNIPCALTASFRIQIAAKITKADDF